MLRIELDPDSKVVRPGEAVSGLVHVEPDRNMRCKGLSVQLRWRTTGRGNTEKKEVATRVLFMGEWVSGQVANYPFSFPAPNDPLTYEGHHVAVEWAVTARADVPFALDPKADAPFALAPGGPGGHVPAALLEKAGVPVAKTRGGCLIVVAIWFFMMTPIGGGAAAFGVIAGGLALWGALYVILARAKIGGVDLICSTPVIYPGSTLQAQLAVRLKGAAHFNAVTATLVGTERAVKGGGKHKKTHTYSLHKRTISLTQPGPRAAGSDPVFDIEFPVPDVGAYTFEGTSNRVKWQLNVHLDIAKWPDFRQVFPLVMWGQRQPTPALHRSVAAPAAARASQELAPWPVDPAVPAPEVQPLPVLLGAPVLAPDLQKPDVLGKLVAELSELPSYSTKYIEIVAEHDDKPYELSVHIERMEETFGFDAPEAFQRGRTVTGSIVGIEDGDGVKIRFPKARNDVVGEWVVGQTVIVVAKLTGWDTLYSRLTMDAV